MTKPSAVLDALPEIIRLREVERLGVTEIARRVGISWPTVNNALRPYPLLLSEKLSLKRNTAERNRTASMKGGGKNWMTKEIAALKSLWPSAMRDEIEQKIPRRSWFSVTQKASKLSLTRSRSVGNARKRQIHPIFVQLRQRREAREITRVQMAEALGYDVQTISQWELGLANPRWAIFLQWVGYLGFELSLAAQQKEVPAYASSSSKSPDWKRYQAIKGAFRAGGTSISSAKRVTPWSESQTQLLRELVNQGSSTRELETILERSHFDILSKGDQLGLWKLKGNQLITGETEAALSVPEQGRQVSRAAR